MNRKNVETKFYQARDAVRGVFGKVAAGGTALLASGAALASATPGSAIAGELSGGKTDLMLVIAAAAVLIGVLILWAYMKRAR